VSEVAADQLEEEIVDDQALQGEAGADQVLEEVAADQVIQQEDQVVEDLDGTVQEMNEAGDFAQGAGTPEAGEGELMNEVIIDSDNDPDKQEFPQGSRSSRPDFEGEDGSPFKNMSEEMPDDDEFTGTGGSGGTDSSTDQGLDFEQLWEDMDDDEDGDISLRQLRGGLKRAGMASEEEITTKLLQVVHMGKAEVEALVNIMNRDLEDEDEPLQSEPLQFEEGRNEPVQFEETTSPAPGTDQAMIPEGPTDLLQPGE